MIRQLLLWACLSLGLTACQYQEFSMNNQVTGYDKNGLPKATKYSVKFKTNPHPQQAYQVKVKVHDAPGPLKLIVLKASYRANNCEYTVNRHAGATNNPENTLNIQTSEFSNNQVEGTFYLDAMLNEDYYGQGVCEWKLTSVSAQFKASHDPDDTTFIIGGFAKNLLPTSSTKLYYLKEQYPKTYVKGELLPHYSNFGSKEKIRNLVDFTENDWFHITMDIKEGK